MEVIAQTAIVVADKPGQAIRAEVSNHPAKPHYVLGTVDGCEVAIALAGKGGVDINKVASGKVLALAADGFRPALEKSADGATGKQKEHAGRPLYLASGFYLLSTREYQAHTIVRGWMRLLDEGERVAMLTSKSLAAARRWQLGSRQDLLALHEWGLQQLDDRHNFLHRFDAEVNRRKQRLLQRAMEDAQDAGEVLQAVQHQDLQADPKDGSGLLAILWRKNDRDAWREVMVRRHLESVSPEGEIRQVFASPKEAMAALWATDDGREMARLAKAGQVVQAVAVRGVVMRTSVSCRKKIDNARAAHDPSSGEAVWLLAALRGWVPGIAPVLSMRHPQWPQKDYDTLHYVAAPRQAMVKLVQGESGMVARADTVALADLVAEHG